MSAQTRTDALSAAMMPQVEVVADALADVDFSGQDFTALVVAVAPAQEADEGLQPRPGTADVAARYGIDLAELADRAPGSGFAGKAGDVSAIDLPRAHAGSVVVLPWHDLPHRIILLGVGAGTDADLRAAGLALAGVAKGGGRVASLVTNGSGAAGVRAFVEGYLLGAYRIAHFDPRAGGVLGRAPVQPGGEVARLDVIGPDAGDAIAGARRAARATWLARDLANTPSNIKTPQWLADLAGTLARDAGLVVRVRDEAELAAEGFGAIVAVGAGSVSPPRLVTVTYPGRNTPGRKRVVVVGKGITYDTGGISIKPREAMVPMKTDMAGAAVALATVLGAAEAGIAHEVTAVMPLAENHFGAASMRPGDVVRSFNGLTIEVANTDAEGRMVLADALAFAAQGNPDLLIDVATLTGAASLGLGRGHGALYSVDDDAARALEQAATDTGEQVWRMPLEADYLPAVKSAVGDVRNSPEKSPGGGSITAALFLQAFTGGLPWVHLDIAGPARSEAGATGYGARLLLRYLEDLPVGR